MRLAGREGETDWQTVGVHDSVNLARETSSRAAHTLMIVVRNASSVRAHAHDGGVDHLHRRIMASGQRAARPGGVNSAGWNHSA